MAGFVVPTVEEVISSRRDSTSYTELRFPDDLGPHAMVFNFSDYSFDRAANTKSTVLTSSICLPMPTNLTDQTGIRIQAADIGYLGDLSRNLVNIGKGATSVEDFFSKAVESGDLAGSTVSKALRSAIASTDTGLVRGVESALGTIVNPHTALTFEGMNLKQHSFQWQLAPTSPSESMRLAKITRTIKASILPTYKKDAGRTFLQYPKVVDIFFLGTEPGHLYFFKRCMVSAFEVNYAPTGAPVFLPGGRPGFVEMKMDLSEMEIHTADDYTGATQ